MDGHHLVTQALKDHTTVQLEQMFALEEQSLMLITKHVSIQESTFQEQTLRSCLANGSSRLVHALVLKWVTISGLQDTCS